MDERFVSLRMMVNLGLRYDNIPWLGRAGNLHLPPVVLTPGMIGHFEDSGYGICKNLDIMDERIVSVLKSCFKIYSGGCNKLQKSK